jgi:hypothetical protein
MIETHEYAGLWWLPHNDARKFAGTLVVTRGKAKLEVLGAFADDQAPFEMSLAHVPRILGMSTNGKAITLERCVPTSRNLNFPGLMRTTFRAQAVLVGAWFSEGEEVTFDEIAFRTSDLDTWAMVSGFSHGFTGEEEAETGLFVPSDFEFKFTPPPSIEIPLDDGFSASIRFAYHQTGLAPVTTTLTLTQAASFYLRFPGARSLNEAETLLGLVRNFLTLAIGRPLTLLAVTGYKDDLLNPASKRPEPVEVLYETPNNPDPPHRDLHPTEMMFTLSEAKPSISEVLRAWFSRQEILRPVFNLYFGALYHPTLFLDQRFIAYAQAIETYDRRRRNATDLPQDEHERRVVDILAATPAEHAEWLKTKLKHSNSLVLGKRLRDVIAECPPISKRIFGPSRKRTSALRQIVDTRNYHTHYDVSLEHAAAKGAELYLRTVQLRAMIEMSLLRELGFACEDIGTILDRVERYREIEHFRELVSAEAS